MATKSGHIYSTPKSFESRQRRRSIHINMEAIHSIALLCDKDGLDEEDIGQYVLLLTYNKLPPKNWWIQGNERVTYWTIERNPSDITFYDQSLYKLTVQTWQEPIPTKYPPQ